VRGFLEETSNSSELPSQKSLRNERRHRAECFSREFLKETLASSNGAEAVTVFWRNEQIHKTDVPAERATMPGGAFSRGFLDETDDFRNEHGTQFLRNGRICRTDKFAERTLCGTSDDAEWSVSCGILEETVVSSNSAESVMVFWRNNSEFTERTSLWNEQR